MCKVRLDLYFYIIMSQNFHFSLIPLELAEFYSGTSISHLHLQNAFLFHLEIQDFNPVTKRTVVVIVTEVSVMNTCNTFHCNIYTGILNLGHVWWNTRSHYRIIFFIHTRDHNLSWIFLTHNRNECIEGNGPIVQTYMQLKWYSNCS